MYDATKLLAFCAVVLSALWTYILAPYIKAKTSASQQERLLALIKMAVQAMEQTIKKPGSGKEKMNGAIQWLRNRGITVDIEELRALIEASVFEMNAGLKAGDSDA